MSAQLHELRAAAARRRHQNEGLRVPLQSPAASDCDADNMSLQSLQSAASSRRSNLSRHSHLMSVASAKSEQYDSTLLEYLRPTDLEDEEERENDNPNMYQEVQSVKSVVQEEENTTQKPSHKEKPSSENSTIFVAESQEI